VACAGIGPAGAVNAAVLAAEIVALGDAALTGRLRQYKAELAEKTLAKDRKIQDHGT
jgi:5-(carboxyamino)imidazole ribonucleotide mutase